MKKQKKQPTNQDILKTVKQGFEKLERGNKKLEVNIKNLKKEDERILKSILDFAENTEQRFNNLEHHFAELNIEHEDIIIKLNNMVYRFEFNALEQRVDKQETKIKK